MTDTPPSKALGVNPYDLDFSGLDGYFCSLGIDTSAPGFYDEPAFIKQEAEDPDFLSLYARYVQLRPRTPEYDNHVREITSRISPIVHAELVAEGRLGACIDLSQVLSRILESEGVWCVLVRGGLTISFPSHLKIPTTYFWPQDTNGLPGHTWVYAPPYDVIDLTVAQQPYSSEKIRSKLPPYVLAEKPSQSSATIKDIYSPEYIENTPHLPWPHLQKVAHRTLRRTLQLFPASLVRTSGAALKYVPCAFSASDGKLEEIENQRWNGRFGHEIYRDLIKVNQHPLK